MNQNYITNQPMNTPGYYISLKRKVLDFMIGLITNLLSIPLFILFLFAMGNMADMGVFSVDLHRLLGMSKDLFLQIGTAVIIILVLGLEYKAIKRFYQKRHYIATGMLLPLLLLVIIMFVMLRWAIDSGYGI
ncbi:MAG: hypothetical protein Q8P32_00985 [Candidatus Komeilibacteria bacterium]|nr:hypothetical protein [Candidatus Komeilibacteria bacterium]